VKQLTKQPRQKCHITELIVTVTFDTTTRSYHDTTNNFQWLTAPDLQSQYQKKKSEPQKPPEEKCRILKGMIIAFFYCLRNITLVAHIIGWPWTTIKSFLTRACECESLDNLPRAGRTIIRQAKSNHKMTRSDFRDKYTPSISLSTGNKKKTRSVHATLSDSL